MAEATTCRHCDKRIVTYRDYQNREVWTHQHADASFQDGRHYFCHRTAAEPAPEAGESR